MIRHASGAVKRSSRRPSGSNPHERVVDSYMWRLWTDECAIWTLLRGDVRQGLAKWAYRQLTLKTDRAFSLPLLPWAGAQTRRSTFRRYLTPVSAAPCSASERVASIYQ